jgi:predicted cytidylate kinase
MIISIGGMSGSGKNRVASILAERLGMKSYSIGEFRRNMAAERNITLTQFNNVGEKQDFTDKKADDHLEKLGKEGDNFIVAGRLAFHFIPDSVKILLKSHLRIRAERAYNDERDLEKFRDLGDSIANLIGREKSDVCRFKNYYDVDCNNELAYDLVINTDNLNFEEVAEKIIEFLKKENILKEAI